MSNPELNRNWCEKTIFLLFAQLCLFSLVLFSLSRTIFPWDFLALDSISPGGNATMAWFVFCLIVPAILLKFERISEKALFIWIPAGSFLVFSLLTHAFASMGIWFFGVLFLSAGLLWFLQTLLVSRLPLTIILLFPLNLLVSLLVYIDSVHYSITKEHLNLIYLRILRTINADIFAALTKHGISTGVFFLALAAGLTMLLLIYPALRFGPAIRLPRKKSLLMLYFLLQLLFIPLYFQFVFLAPGVTLSEYMNFKIRNFWFPLPNHPVLSTEGRQKIDELMQKQPVNPSDFFSQATYAWQPRNRRKNIIFLVIESLRPDYMLRHMSKTVALAQTGIFCQNHVSNANETEGSLLSLYYATLPLPAQRSHYDRVASSWLSFMKDSQYELLRLHCSSFNLLYPDYSYVNIRDYYRKNRLNFPEKTTIDENSRYICEATIHKLKNSDKKCIIEAYLFHTHYRFWFPESYTKFLPVLEENSEILTHDFKEVAEKFANRYRNSLLYTDDLIADLVANLKKEGLFADTLLVIMGDHGQILGESDKLFHGNGGEILQYKTPLLIIGDDVPAVKIDKMTSHIDIVPTLGHLLGFSTEKAHGNSVLDSRGNGVVTFDIAGHNRVCYRDKDFSSLFYYSQNLEWVLLCSHDFNLSEDFERLYQPQNISGTFKTVLSHSEDLIKIIKKAQLNEL